jgi:hypothetical protein
MIDAIWLASVSKCASATLCPTDRDLLSTVYWRDGEIAFEVAKAYTEKNPRNFEMVHQQKVKGISDVHCGGATTEAPASITCSFTLKYWSSICYTSPR